MFKKIRVIVMIFALGIFVLPKQILSAQIGKMEQCCKSAKSSERCCCTSKEESKSKKENSEKNSCGSACNSCSLGHGSTIFLPSKLFEVTLCSLGNTSTHLQFSYISPVMCEPFSKIWQPPKIG